MNLHTTYIDTKKTIKRNRTESRRKGSRSLTVVFRIVALLVVFFLIASTRALFNSEREKLNRRAVSLKGKIHTYNRKIDNLQIKQEQYHGRYILTQIKHFNLKLQYPRAGQVRKIRFSTRTPDIDNERTEMSEMLLTQR
jgi:hypothetical protein